MLYIFPEKDKTTNANQYSLFVFMKTTLYKIDVILYQMVTQKYALYIY